MCLPLAPVCLRILGSLLLLLCLPLGAQATDFILIGTGPESVTVGTPAVFNFTLDNTSTDSGGPFTPDNNRFFFNLPPQFGFAGTSFPGGTCAVENGQVNCVPPPVAAGQTLDFTLTLDALAAGNPTIRFQAETNLFDPNPNNNFVDITTLIHEAQVPDLSIVKTVDRQTVASGDSLTFTLTVTAVGRAFQAVQVHDLWPRNLDFIDAQVGDGTSTRSCTLVERFADTLSCELETLAPGETVVITVRAIAREVGTLTNEARVVSLVDDALPENNTSTVELNIGPRTQADIDLEVHLKIDKADSLGFDSLGLFFIGTELKLEVVLINHGPETATGVTLVQHISGVLGIDAKTVIPEVASCSLGDGALTCTIDRMAPGNRLVFKYTNILHEVEPLVLEAEATAQGPVDYRPGNNSELLETSVSQGLIIQPVNLTSAPADVSVGGADPFPVDPLSALPAGCPAADPALCLSGDRFRVQVEWRIPNTTDPLGTLDEELNIGAYWNPLFTAPSGGIETLVIENPAYAGDVFERQDTFFNNTATTVQLLPVPLPTDTPPLIIDPFHAAFPDPMWPEGTHAFEVLNGAVGTYPFAPGGNLVVINEAPPGKGGAAYEVFVIDAGGNRTDAPDVTAAEDDRTGLPSGFALSANYPNPFNPQTTLSYALPTPARVHLAVFDVTGRLVQTLVDADLPAGTHTATWTGTYEAGQAAATGVYFYRLTAGDFVATRKMMLVK